MQNAGRFDRDDIVVINLSGRGDKDVAEVAAITGRS
jgi:tryptophan synthase beta subunit